jgi:hypothetical protein
VIDTVRFHLIGSRLRPDCRRPFERHSVQLPRAGASPLRVESGVRFRLGCSMNVSGNDERGYWVHGSLPRYHYGNNSRLLASEADLQAATDSLTTEALEYVTPPSHMEFTRVDLCWHFCGDPGHFIASHQGCPHPRIRGVPFVKPGESLCWGSRDGQLRILMYDKSREQTGKHGNVVRVEVSLRKALLSRELNNNNGRLQRLVFRGCYQAFRRILLEFSPNPCAKLEPGKGSLVSLLAHAEMAGANINGQSLLDLYVQRFGNSQAAARFRRKVHAAKPAFGGVDWHELLPAGHPPRAVELVAA